MVKDFPKIVNDSNTIVFPEIKTYEEVLEIERVFDQEFESSERGFFSHPLKHLSQNDLRVFEYVKKWFHVLCARNDMEKENLVLDYGRFLRRTAINVARSEHATRLYPSSNLIFKLKFYFSIILLSISQTANDNIAIKFGKLMGPKHEQEIKQIIREK